MEIVTVSTKYQVVIPLKVRRLLGIKPGLKVQVIPYGNHVALIPLQRVRQMRGFLKGIDTTIEREGGSQSGPERRQALARYVHPLG